jgi:type II secretory pathway component PulL
LLDELGHAGEPVLLALGSSDVVTTSVPLPTRRTVKRAALAFLAEPALPWSAEDSVIDFESGGSERAFVVATKAAPLKTLFAALEERGIRVASVAPMARLALEHHLVHNPRAAVAPRYALLWGHAETIDLWLIDQDRPTVWRWIPRELASVAQSVKQLALCETEDLILAGRNLPEGLLRALGERTGLKTCSLAPLDSEDSLTCCAIEAARVLAGRRQAPIELCRGQLAPADRHRSIRPQLRLLNASLALLMVAIGLGAGFKGVRTASVRVECEAREAGLFESVFPKEKVPVAINLHLQSELARLRGLRGETTDLPQLVPYLAVLERLFQGLPAEMRFRLLEIRIENGRLSLVGQVRSHADADRIADGLRAAGLDVAAPNTNRLEKEGVEFRISARLPAPPAKQPLRRAG